MFFYQLIKIITKIIKVIIHALLEYSIIIFIGKNSVILTQKIGKIPA